MVKVLVAHEHRLFRQALVRTLSLQQRISIIGDAENSEEVIKKIEQLMPDVIVVDSVMPGLRDFLKEGSDQLMPEVFVFPRRKNGKCGSFISHLAYNDELNDLVEAILCAAGEKSEEGRCVSDEILKQLTNRERQILALVADGLSNKQIGALVKITERTVKYHISNILRKLDLLSRTEAAVAFLKGSPF